MGQNLLNLVFYNPFNPHNDNLGWECSIFQFEILLHNLGHPNKRVVQLPVPLCAACAQWVDSGRNHTWPYWATGLSTTTSQKGDWQENNRSNCHWELKVILLYSRTHLVPNMYLLLTELQIIWSNVIYSISWNFTKENLLAIKIWTIALSL